MSGIKGKNTRPELIIRKGLFAAGYRFRLHQRQLPGTPDLVLRSRSAAVFVHGCFWHQHPNCRYAAQPKSNTAFWRQKLVRNVERDRHAIDQLRGNGWRVLVIWECATRAHDAESVLHRVVKWIEGGESYREIPDLRGKLASGLQPVAKPGKARQPGRTKRELGGGGDKQV